MGCFLEQLVIAASADGYKVELTPLPDSDTGPIAKAVFTKGASPDPLAAQIPDRHCEKGVYTGVPMAPDAITALSPYANIITTPEQVETLRNIRFKALKIELFTPRTLKESIDVMRFGKAEINANPDGIEL